MKLEIIKAENVVLGKRFREDYGNIESLILSIKQKTGIIQPIAVKQLPDGKYLLLAGGRRMAAVQRAEIKDVPARIYDEELNEYEVRSIELSENLDRKDLSWDEKASLCKEIDDLQTKIYGRKVSTSPNAPGWSKVDTAQMIGRSPASVVQDIILADALKAFPELKLCKNKDEAKKLLMKLRDDMTRNDIAQRLQEKLGTPLDVARNELCNNFVLQDFFEGIKMLPSESIDLVELDPPYGIDLANMRKSDSSVEMIDYNEVDKTDYLQFLNRVFVECYRTMAKSSWLILWFAMEPWFESVFTAAKKAGFSGSRVGGIWAKSRGQTLRPDMYLANTYEMFFYLRKGSPVINSQGRSNFFTFPGVAPQRRIHPTERPVELIQEILSTFTKIGSRILVPFLGSGNTLLASSNLGIQAVGFELSKTYKDGYILRVHEGQPGKYKSYGERGDTYE